MPSRSPSRGRTRTRSPYSDVSNGRPGSRSRSAPRRSITPRSPSRTPRRNGGGRYRTESRSRSASRGRSPSPMRSTKVVIEKLTKNVNEDHLREIFGVYGQIRDLDMPMNRQFNTNRGTAYILFTSEADAEAAIAHMHESQIDGAVINVSIVLPRRKFSPSPPTARRGANIDPRIPLSANFQRPAPAPVRRRSPLPAYNQDLPPVRDLQEDIARDQDLYLRARGHHLEEEEAGEIVLLAMAAVDGEEALAIAVTVAMTIGAEVEAAEEEVEADARQGAFLRKYGFGV